MVYTLWEGKNDTSYGEFPSGVPLYPDWLNATAVDDVFEFGEKYNRRPPVFARLPSAYNTILNETAPWQDSIYILAAKPNASYMMCSLKASLSIGCTTEFGYSMNGAYLQSDCDTPSDVDAYNISRSDATDGVIQPDWSDVAAEWAKSVALKAGISDSNASIPRLLTELIPTNMSLDPSVPSIAEALAALASTTLLSSARDAPFDLLPYHPTPNSPNGTMQGFSATVSKYEYRSGFAGGWQCSLYVVLAGTFVVNCYCVQYLIRNWRFRTDFTEPPNLFALAINSRPGQGLEEESGGEPCKDEFGRKWSVGLGHHQNLGFEKVAAETLGERIADRTFGDCKE